LVKHCPSLSSVLPRRDEQSLECELGCVLLHWLLAMDGIIIQDEPDRLTAIVYSTPPSKPSTKSVTSCPD
jgi:hypothetical protein